MIQPTGVCSCPPSDFIMITESFTLVFVYFNDMWVFNLTSGWWSWVNGGNVTNQEGIYGTRGMPSASNRPGARSDHSMVMHPSAGNFFLFGGGGFNSLQSGMVLFADLFT